LPALTWGAENFPPPEFTTGYQLPRTTAPAPRAEVFGYVDVAVLLAMLLLSAWLVHKKRSRRELLIVTVFSLLYFGFYRHGCVCAVGSLQNVAMAIGQSGYALPLVVGIFFLLPLLVALFAGRVFCAGVCPLGAIQDLLLHKPVKVPAWLEHPLSLLPYAYLGAAVLFAATGSDFLICKYDPFVAFFRLNGQDGMLLAGVILLLIGVVVGRPYCRFLCPYGVLLRFAAPFAKWRVRVTPKGCVQCHLCAEACPFDAIRPPTPPHAVKSRFEGRRRLAITILLLPLLLALGGWLGHRASGAFAGIDPTIIRANAAWQQEQHQPQANGIAVPLDPASPNIALYRRAVEIRRQFDLGTPFFGMWIGLVIGLKLVFLSIRRRRSEYEVDQAACLGCARCYAACPVDHQEVREAVARELSES